MFNNNIYIAVLSLVFMELIEKLQASGLTGNEAKVYLELIKIGEASANQIAKNIGMDRTLAYTVLNHLIEKGQVNYIIKKGKKIFSCSSLDSLLNQVKSKEILISELINELKTFEKRDSPKTKIEIYEGKEGLRTMFRLLWKYKSFCSFGATGRAYEALYESNALAKEWIKNKGSGRVITNHKYKNHEMTNLKNMFFKYLDVESESTTTIYGDYVSIHTAIDKPFIILINDKNIAKSYLNHFEVLWKVAKA